MPETILIVDDDPEDNEFLKMGCEVIGFQNAVFYNNTTEAIKFLLSLEDNLLPSLIVTDNNMPTGNGYNFIEYLKTEKRLSSIKTAVLSSGFSQTEIERFKAIGVDGIFIKPNEMSEYENLCHKLKELADNE
ncbi:MAG: response regulator [Segetibacter sp.]|nr:response regulator [Segetibacter sp.]